MGAETNQPHYNHHADNACCTDNTQLAEDQGFDAFELHVLEIARYFFVTWSDPHSQSWMEAFLRAEQMFPPPFGATIANAVVVMLNAMRVARPHLFNYHNPRCVGCSRQITDEERYLISALHAVRRGQRSTAETQTLMLCEGRDASGFLAACERLAIITSDIARPDRT